MEKNRLEKVRKGEKHVSATGFGLKDQKEKFGTLLALAWSKMKKKTTSKLNISSLQKFRNYAEKLWV